MWQHPNAPVSPGYTDRYSGQAQYGQQYMQRAHLPLGVAQPPAGAPSGMDRAGMSMQHAGHMPSPDALPRGMPPQAVMPVQPGLPYLGFYPAAYYYAAQNPGDSEKHAILFAVPCAFPAAQNRAMLPQSVMSMEPAMPYLGSHPAAQHPGDVLMHMQLFKPLHAASSFGQRTSAGLQDATAVPG